MLYRWLASALMALLPFLVLGSVAFTSLRTSAQPLNNQTRKPTPLFVGMAECARCHRQPNKDEPAPLLCRCNEVHIWETQDKHRIAHLVLRKERSVQMGKLLGIEDPASDKRCVACHGVIIADEKLRHRSFPPERAIQEGVTCVVCHGPYKEWIDLHGGIDRETWRTLSRKRKEEEYGMVDLWDPVRRAQLCVSCHVGDPSQGRLVTHAMYAAGHPPLAAFELVAYSDAMPRHWQYLDEKPASIRTLLEITDDQARYEKTRIALFGALVAFRQSQQILLQATSPPENQLTTSAWPDFSHFDCYGCHRLLRRDHWKSSSSSANPPSGRPGWRSWPAQFLAIRPGLATLPDPLLQPDPSLALNQAFRSTPFGHADGIRAAAIQNLAYCEKILGEVNTMKLTRPKLLLILQALSDPTNSFPADFDSARLRLCLLKAIYEDVEPKPPNGQEIQRVLDTLATELALDLPKTRTDLDAPPDPRLLEAAIRFDPERIRSHLNALHAMLRNVPQE